ncbi:MAG: MBL fold metallo-hydrolase [Nitrosopumilaceae archaeon]|nr:MBL fold metallo-hydrolase [Nitrosopumilaceae archaeon]
MGVEQIPVGRMQNFTYIISDYKTKDAIILDPSWDLAALEQVIRRDSLHVTHIVNTHHHFDHTTGNGQMAQSTGAPIAQHEASELPHDISLRHGDAVALGDSALEVLHTPGHSKDSICLVGDGKIFTGDTLFVGTCGRVDLPGGSARELYRSIFDTLANLEDSLVMYPGHDYGAAPTSTLGDQKQGNPVMRPVSEEQFVARMTMG